MKYKVKTGFGDDDFTIIDETELAMGLRAQIGGKVALFREGSISGNSILEIKPYYNRLMGWNREYRLTDEDYLELGQEIKKRHNLFFENTKLAIEGRPPVQEKPKEISEGVKQLAEKMGTSFLDT